MLALLLLILLAAAWLLSLWFTGRVPRAYAVLSPDDLVEIAGEELTVQEIARSYQPLMYIRQTTPSPPLLWAWYEAVAAPDSLDLVYFHVWADEVHPNRLVDRLYRLFRGAYYGTPTYDVEYFQVEVARQDGAVIGLNFETSPGDDYYPAVSEHLIARVNRQADGALQLELFNRSGERVAARREVSPLFDDRRIKVGAQTWNHLSELVLEEGTGYDQLMETELRPLSDEEYRRFKFARKSQGSHRTEEDRTRVWLTFLGLAAAALAAIWLVSSILLREAPDGSDPAA